MIPVTRVKSRGDGMPVIPVLGKQDRKGAFRTHWPPSLGKLVSSRFRERLFVETLHGRRLGKISNLHTHSHTNIQMTSMCLFACTQTHTYKVLVGMLVSFVSI